MRAYHGMDIECFAPVCVLAHLGRSLRAHPGLWTGDHAVGMHSPQALERALQSRRQAVVSEILVGEQGIPAIGRHFDGIKYGTHRRLRYHRGIGMPVFTNDLLVAGLAPDINDFRIGTDTIVVRVYEDLTKAPGKRLVPLYVELLVSKEDHAVIEECLTDLIDHDVVEILCDINAANFSA